MLDILRTKLENVYKYHHIIECEDVEKTYQRDKYQGMYLFEIDNNVLDHLKLVGEYNVDEIMFVVDGCNIDEMRAKPNIIRELQLEPVDRKHLINKIKYKRDIIITALGLLPDEFEDAAIKSPDILVFIQKLIETNDGYYEALRAVIPADNNVELQRIIDVYTNKWRQIHGNKIELCKSQYDRILEMNDAQSDDFISIRGNNILKIKNDLADDKLNRGEKILYKHLQIDLINPSLKCNNFDFTWSKEDTPQYATQNCNLTTDEMLVDYMPEYYFTDDHKYRQTVLGLLTAITKYSKCTKKFIADVFVSNRYNLDHISWSPEFNKVFMNCITRNDLIFPIRFVVEDLTKIGRYKVISNLNELTYIGMFIIPLYGSCNYMNYTADHFKFHGNQKTYHQYFVYYNSSRSSFQIFNFRGNMISMGEFFEEFRVMYIELNILMYSGLKCYRYLDTDVYFFSKYNKATIRQKYEELSKKYASDTLHIDIDAALSKLTEYKIQKSQVTKQFLFIKDKNDQALQEVKETEAFIAKLKSACSKYKISIKSKKPVASRIAPIKSNIFTKCVGDHFTVKGTEIERHYNTYKDKIRTNKNERRLAFIEYNAVAPDDLTKINKIVELYNRGSVLTLSKINELDQENRLYEPKPETGATFLQERQTELNRLSPEVIDKYHMTLLKDNGVDCHDQRFWSTSDIPEYYPTEGCAKFDEGVYPYLIQYIPEVLENPDNTHNLRPTVLGFLSEQEKYDKCQKYFRTKFTINSDEPLEYYNWSMQLNRTFIHCILKTSTLLFPFLLVDPEFNKVGIYSTFYPDADYQYLGLLTVPFKDDRIGKRHLLESFVFFVFRETLKGVQKIVLFNERGNRVSPGNYYDELRITYVEINQLLYEAPKYHWYLYKPSTYNYDKRIYLFSSKSRDEIKNVYETRYSRLFNSSEINTILNDLQEVTLKKRKLDKIFFFQ